MGWFAIERKLILKWIINKWSTGNWAGLKWLRIDSSGGVM
jgi:hypothetical protein